MGAAVKVALYARTSAADLGIVTTDEILSRLATYAEGRGWEVALRAADRGPWLEGRRPGLEALQKALAGGQAGAVLIQSLNQLARSLRHLTELGQLLDDAGVALVAVDEAIDGTDPLSAIRWRDWVRLASRFDERVRREGTRVAKLRSSETWGRPFKPVNPLELLGFWEGRGGRKPLSSRQIAKRLGVSETTVRARLAELRSQGQVNDEARQQALAARGGPTNGGRPARPLDEADLVAAWARCPKPAKLARAFRVGLPRIKETLRALGLLEADR